MVGRGLILVVDDEDGMRGLAARHLRKHGYEVLEASDGLEALASIQARGSQIALVLCEAVMPGLDGPTLVKRAEPWLPAGRFKFRSGNGNRPTPAAPVPH